MNTATKVRKNEAAFAGQISDGEVIILTETSDDYISLTGSALEIWNLIDEPRSIDSLVAKLLEDYDSDRASIENDVVDFVKEMIEKQLIQIVDDT